MRGIILKDSIKLFGFKDGFSFWFEWSFISPIEMFIWLNITHKPYCTYSGFHCHKENCEHKHLFTKKDILKHWKKYEEESKVIHEGKNGMCTYCGEEKGTKLIDDPNWDTLERWKVCKTCERLINHQRDFSFGKILTTDKDFNRRNLGLEISKKADKEIKKIEEETGKKTFVAELNKSGIEV